jgi:2-polyprenyl-6-methoxyphenol hydroxylase-like FAD-dependent oxidoreductase
MKNLRVLISGASIAGPALAYWLARRGFRPTVVERFGELRPGGNGVDIRGASVGIAERMGILPELRRHATQIDDTTFVDAGDRRTANIPMTTFNAGGDIEIMRGDLGRVVHDATKDDVEYVFGDSIIAIDDHGPAVTVTFDSGEVREFDLVVGADGLHSAVRGLTFGPDSEAMHHLGLYFAIASADPQLGRDRSVVLYNTPGKAAGVYRSGNHAGATAFFAFREPAVLDFDFRDGDQQKDIIRDRFAGQGWHVPALVERAVADDRFYFDSVSQIRMPRWSKGRVTLVGDAGYCATLLSGAGASLAFEGAHLLAAELEAAGGDHTVAFRRYEEKFRPTVKQRQASVRASAAILIPRSRAGIWTRNQFTRLMGLQTAASFVYRRTTSLPEAG